MLELFDQNPQSRVFHVDRECYVVYLGSHWEDYKPFLRLGTSTHLPSELPPIVSTIVVPDALTGNPLDEPACLAGDAKPDTRYVGDVDTVEHMKSFVGQETIPVSAIEQVDHEEDDGKHVLVYYYKDGNLKIKFRKNEILDLRRREKLDAHFVARAQEAKNEYGRSPFKIPASAYQGYGFVVVAGTSYLLARGELAALRLTEDYFFELSGAGLDADRVSTIQAEDADTALIRFFKRSRTRNRPVRISTPRAERVKQASELFPGNSLPPLNAKIAEGHGGAFDFHRFSVTQAPGRFEAALDELDGPIVFGSAAKRKSNAAIVVDPSAGSITFSGSRGTEPLLEGAVYQIGAEKLTRTDVQERYLPEKNYPYRDLLSQSENTLISQLGYFFSELFAGRDTGKVLRTIRGLDPIKSIGKADADAHPLVQIVLHNYKHYVDVLRAHEPELARRAEGLASLLERHHVVRADVPAMLPLVGEIYHDDGQTYLFYRFVARITSDRYGHAERVVENIRAVPSFDFEAERKRLADLISGLATPEQMDEARMRRIAQQQEKKREEKATQAERAEAEPAAAAGRSRSRRAAADKDVSYASTTSWSGPKARKPGARGGGAGRWIIVAATVVVIGVLLALLMTGTIPNRWFADGDAVVATDGTEPGVAGDGDADEPAADGASGNGEPEDDGAPSDGGAASGDGEPTDGATAGEDGAADEQPSIQDDPDGGGTQLPEGWPPDALPAIQALEDTPGVTITRDRVTGPGGIEITLQDIIDLVNRIATDNGYAPMGEVDAERPDPDWIYPGNVFVLPNETRYTVVEGDTLWEITVRYMVARLRRDYERYTDLVAEYEAEGTSDSRRAEIAATLEATGDASHTENFSRLVEERLEQWGELGEGG
ncbi:MAG: hypothetical protein ACOCU9_02050 [Spirochaetota bacterium]